MRKKGVRPILSIEVALVCMIAAILAATGCAGSSVSPNRSSEPFDLTIIHTADNGGYIDPCG
jgi:hypothetical protein